MANRNEPLRLLKVTFEYDDGSARVLQGEPADEWMQETSQKLLMQSFRGGAPQTEYPWTTCAKGEPRP